MDCNLISIEKNATLIDINISLEEEINKLNILSDKLKIENNGLKQRLTLNENELLKLKQEIGKINTSSSNAEVAGLRNRIREIEIEKEVYMTKINELVNQLNKAEKIFEDSKTEYEKLIKQLKQANNNILLKVSSTENELLKTKESLKKDYKSFENLDNIKINKLQLEIDNLRQNVLTLKNQNMDLQNKLSDHNRSKSKTIATKKRIH